MVDSVVLSEVVVVVIYGVVDSVVLSEVVVI